MNSQEFEDAIQGRVVCPKSMVNYSSILFQTEYAPEEMVKKMNAPGNSSQTMDRMKNGLNKYKYSANTLTGGYIFCQVDDNPPATGEKGDIVDVPEWVKNVAMHAVSGFLLGFSSTFVLNPAINTMPELSNAIYGAVAIGFYGALKEIAAYVETMVKGKATAAKGGETTLTKRMI